MTDEAEAKLLAIPTYRAVYLAEAVRVHQKTLENALGEHFGLFRPIPPRALIPAAIEAIDLCGLGMNYVTVPLPDGVAMDGQRQPFALDLVDELNLWPYVNRCQDHEGEMDAEHLAACVQALDDEHRLG